MGNSIRTAGGHAEESVRWFRRSTEQGNAHAQTDLGAADDAGRGLQEDEEAVRWRRLSGTAGRPTRVTPTHGSGSTAFGRRDAGSSRRTEFLQVGGPAGRLWAVLAVCQWVARRASSR